MHQSRACKQKVPEVAFQACTLTTGCCCVAQICKLRALRTAVWNANLCSEITTNSYKSYNAFKLYSIPGRGSEVEARASIAVGSLLAHKTNWFPIEPSLPKFERQLTLIAWMEILTFQGSRCDRFASSGNDNTLRCRRADFDSLRKQAG